MTAKDMIKKKRKGVKSNNQKELSSWKCGLTLESAWTDSETWVLQKIEKEKWIFMNWSKPVQETVMHTTKKTRWSSSLAHEKTS